ncbi:MAG: hypothetical protein KAI40_09155 [Desulfobacterales bacterium]|nr:hypothetical protein [Desulfobacterales bacterium]
MDNKKIAAATVAVFTYIKTQEEAAYFAAQAGGVNGVEMSVEKTGIEKSSRFSAWANAGRLNQMQQNTMMLMQVR